MLEQLLCIEDAVIGNTADPQLGGALVISLPHKIISAGDRLN